MSVYRENVSWQTGDGTWTIGFYDYDPDDEPDDEDDVRFAMDRFGWLSTGHPDWESALDAYLEEHANPGCGTLLRRIPENAAEIARCEELAAAFIASGGRFVTGDFWAPSMP